jgi:hypothetical protein
MKIPVFVSCPTALSKTQEISRKLILNELQRCGFEARALGRSDYPTTYPLREVLVLAKHCSGGVILGFEQFFCRQGILKRGTVKQKVIRTGTVFPTAWNHLEAGILFGLHLPLLVFKEDGITDGVFDNGVTDVFIYPIPKRTIKAGERQALREVFNKWQADVRNHYYGI